MKRTLWVVALLVSVALGQDGKRANSLFEDSEVKSFPLRSIMVQGEVENAGPVDLSALPLQRLPIKELGIENGKQTFKGAFFVSGYSLYDILNGKRVKKVRENIFSPPIDLYVIVENDQGTKAVFSWGEIYYTKDRSNILITRSVQGINPASGKIQWPLPAEPRLVCGNDLLNVRFMNNPTKITVKSFRGEFAAEKPKDMYASEIRILVDGSSTVVGDIGSSVESRKYSGISYGHGSGFKGMQNLSGFILKELIPSDKTSNYLGEGVAVASAKDGYRSVFSVSEIMNRNDNQDLLLIDKKDLRSEGRYTLFVPGDFFVDRDVKAVEKIEIVHAP